MRESALHDAPVSIRVRLAALWTSVMFLYLYGDYFELYVPTKLSGMIAGRVGPLGPVTEGKLVFTAAMMAIPSLMVALSVILPAAATRWVNVGVALVYTLIICLTAPGGWLFYRAYGVLEIALTAAVVWTAWRWPQRDTRAEEFSGSSAPSRSR